MNFNDDKDDAKNIRYCNRGVKEILNSLSQTPFGIHQILVYPNKYDILREAYFYYIKELLDSYNEIVIFLTYYESADEVKNTLSSFPVTKTTNTTNTKVNYNSNSNSNNNSNVKRQQSPQEYGIDVNRYIENGSLVIIDSDKAFSNLKYDEEKQATIRTNKKTDDDIENNNNFSSLIRMSIAHAKKLKKEGITILADYGYIYNKKGFEYVQELEKSIPYTFNNINIKQICLYSQKDFFHTFTKQQKKEILDLHSRSIIMMDS
jgi:hypothetical protein